MHDLLTIFHRYKIRNIFSRNKSLIYQIKNKNYDYEPLLIKIKIEEVNGCVLFHLLQNDEKIHTFEIFFSIKRNKYFGWITYYEPFYIEQTKEKVFTFFGICIVKSHFIFNIKIDYLYQVF